MVEDPRLCPLALHRRLQGECDGVFVDRGPSDAGDIGSRSASGHGSFRQARIYGSPAGTCENADFTGIIVAGEGAGKGARR